MTLELPWPPSVNNYWLRNRNGSVRVSQTGVAFRIAVCIACKFQFTGMSFGKEKRLAVVVNAFPPDKRRRDLDNLQKGLLDGLQHAGVYADDSQIDDLRVVRMPPVPGGRVAVTIEAM